MNVDKGHPQFPLVPGIVGGLGPFAHIGFEKRLLELATERFGAVSDADFPEWIVSSVPLPEVPVWSDASMNGETYPAPYLLKSLRRLHRAGADFAVIPCNTVHAFLPAIAGQIPLPVVHVVTETVDFVLSRFPSGRRFRRAGLLATTSTCRSGLFSRAFSAHGIELICLCDGEDPSDPSNENPSCTYRLASRGDGANLLFYDGHAKWIGFGDLEPVGGIGYWTHIIVYSRLP